MPARALRHSIISGASGSTSRFFLFGCLIWNVGTCKEGSGKGGEANDPLGGVLALEESCEGGLDWIEVKVEVLRILKLRLWLCIACVRVWIIDYIWLGSITVERYRLGVR